MADRIAKDPALIDEVMTRISEGVPLRQICREDGKPSKSEWYRWLDEDEELKGRFARARDKGFDAIAESCLDIADDATNDWMESLGDDEKAAAWRLNGEHIQRSKLRVETRLKLLAKWDPKRYGDRQIVQGDKGADAVQVEHKTDYSKLSIDELQQFLALAAKANGSISK